MKFIKNLFSKPEPEEVIKEKLLALEIPNTAIYLTDAIEEEDFLLVHQVAEKLIEQNQLDGKLVGKKGWFLPKAQTKLDEVWKELEKGKVDLKTISDQWDLNEKRVFIALNDYAMEQDLEEPVFHRVELDLYLISYFKKAWYDILAAYDEEEEIEFSKLIENARLPSENKSIFKELVTEWLKDGTSRYTLGSDGILRPKEIIPELIEELIPNLWEEGKNSVTYEELAEKYGMDRKEIGNILQKLIDDRALGDVTLYATDEMIKPRM